MSLEFLRNLELYRKCQFNIDLNNEKYCELFNYSLCSVKLQFTEYHVIIKPTIRAFKDAKFFSMLYDLSRTKYSYTLWLDKEGYIQRGKLVVPELEFDISSALYLEPFECEIKE